jgi:hypothetical protein
MKTPRINDFDPDAKTSSLKSPLDKMPAIQRPNPTPPQQDNSFAESNTKTFSIQPTGRPGDEATDRSSDRSTGRGELIRRGFEWYADQLRALKKLSLKEQGQGKPGSMSAMVREALDEYLEKRTSET